LNTTDSIGKFQAKSDRQIFLGYSTTSKPYRVYNIRTNTLEESIHVKFNECLETKRRNEDEEEIKIDPSKEMEKLKIQ